ncbi:MAG: type IV pilus assembly protein PilM [Phycisphaerae bacterium]|nr:type IV pilus assembly protein PilM [Phycisphaerae bacterium]
MPAPRSVWGIDVGQRALKALKLRSIEGELQVEALDIIEHPKILSPEDADRRQIIQASLEQFLARNEISDAVVAVAVPGQTSFTRFVKLPPVEEKKVPDIVRFEAEQQIPFPINEVTWRWQTFHDPDSPDVEVGLFAMKRENVDEAIAQLSEVGLGVDIVQMAPLALYNFMVGDDQLADDGATLLIDVGTDKTDLVVADGARIWTRTIQIGGNNFTEALVRAFKLSFAKAEKLKRSAATSKYARQIFQAMRPVFADLVQEVQRSIGYYTSLHRETRFAKVLGLGNGFRLPGLQKFLQQNLDVPVSRLDSYNNLEPSPAVNAPAFTENVQSLGVAYGLAIQGLGLSHVSTNLLPDELAHRRLWARKRPWFAAAAATLLVALLLPLWSAYRQRAVLADDDNAANVQRAASIIAQQQGRAGRLDNLERGDEADLRRMRTMLDVFGKRAYWPEAYRVIHQAVNQAFDDQPLLTDYVRYLSVPADVRRRIEASPQLDAMIGRSDVQVAEAIVAALPQADQARLRAALLAAEPDRPRPSAAARVVMRALTFRAQARQNRRIGFIEAVDVRYYADIAEAEQQVKGLTGMDRLRESTVDRGRQTQTPSETEPEGRGFAVILTIRTPLNAEQANDCIGVLHASGEQASEQTGLFTITRTEAAPVQREGVSRRGARGAGPEGPGRPYGWPTGGRPERDSGTQDGAAPQIPDPLFPQEDMADDQRLQVGWVLTIE